MKNKIRRSKGFSWSHAALDVSKVFCEVSHQMSQQAAKVFPNISGANNESESCSLIKNWLIKLSWQDEAGFFHFLIMDLTVGSDVIIP